MTTPPKRNYPQKKQETKKNYPLMFLPIFLVLMMVAFFTAYDIAEKRQTAKSAEMTLPVGSGASVSGDDPQLVPTPSPTPQSALVVDKSGKTTQFEGAKPVDLEAELGYFSCAPAHGAQIPLGVDRLALYFARNDLKRGDGMIRIIADDGDTVLHSRPFEDVSLRPMTKDELQYYGYIEGCCFILELNAPLTLAGDMRVELTEGCIASDKYESLRSGAWGSKSWRFRVLPFGVCAAASNIKEPDVSDENAFTIVLGGDAVEAKVTVLTPKTVKVSSESFTETGTLTLSYRDKGEATVSVTFYDSNGKLCGDSSAVISVVVGSGLLKPLD